LIRVLQYQPTRKIQLDLQFQYRVRHSLIRELSEGQDSTYYSTGIRLSMDGRVDTNDLAHLLVELPHLERLEIEKYVRDFIVPEEAQLLGNALLDLKKLAYINFKNCIGVTGPLARAIASLPSLTSLNLSDSLANPQEVMEALVRCNGLTDIDLSNNRFNNN